MGRWRGELSDADLIPVRRTTEIKFPSQHRIFFRLKHRLTFIPQENSWY
jgi:hypothetical protein